MERRNPAAENGLAQAVGNFSAVRRVPRGGGTGIRTPDLLIANETLYQLSYTPRQRRARRYSQRHASCKYFSAAVPKNFRAVEESGVAISGATRAGN